jgi:hypothetical protein
MGGACGMNEEHEKCVRVSFGKPQDKRPLGIDVDKWADNIKKS